MEKEGHAGGRQRRKGWERKGKESVERSGERRGEGGWDYEPHIHACTS